MPRFGAGSPPLILLPLPPRGSPRRGPHPRLGTTHTTTPARIQTLFSFNLEPVAVSAALVYTIRTPLMFSIVLVHQRGTVVREIPT